MTESEALHLVCPACGGKNRVQRRMLDGGFELNCGRCKHALLAAEPEAVSAERLEALIAGSELPLVVDFWAPWCGPCRQMAPQFAASAARSPLVRHIKVDTEAEPAAAQRHGIRSIPTLALFARGREVARQSGAMPADALQQWMQQVLA